MSKEFKQMFRHCVMDNIWFKVLSLSSIILIFTSLLLPPTGIIDPSVISATGEILGWGALFTLIKAIDKGMGAKIQHGNTSVIVKDIDEEEIDEDEHYSNT